MLAYTFYESDFRVMRYAESLARNGNHVELIALRKRGLDFHESINGVHVYRVQERAINEKGKYSYLYRILKFLFRSGCLIATRTPKQKYDLVHVHNVPDFLILAAVIPKFFGAKVILDIHDILPEFYASKFSQGKKSVMFQMMKLVEKVSIGISDHVIISNHLWKEKLENRSVSPDKCTAIINYASQDIFFQRKRKDKNHEMIMLYPGTVNWHQGLDIAILAFDRIKDKAPNLNFHIYGSGTHIGQLKDLIDRLGLKDRIFLYPEKTLREIAEIIANADIGVIPKRNDQFGGEAFSTKSLEFMSCGVPIIMSKTRIDYYYFNDTLVKFFEPGNVEALADAILLMVKDEGLRSTLSKNGIEFAKKNSWNSMQQSYIKLVNGLCR
jgi:glycosyltransferase involved in cell wall biosynthesis